MQISGRTSTSSRSSLRLRLLLAVSLLAIAPFSHAAEDGLPPMLSSDAVITPDKLKRQLGDNYLEISPEEEMPTQDTPDAAGLGNSDQKAPENPAAPSYFGRLPDELPPSERLQKPSASQSSSSPAVEQLPVPPASVSEPAPEKPSSKKNVAEKASTDQPSEAAPNAEKPSAAAPSEAAKDGGTRETPEVKAPEVEAPEVKAPALKALEMQPVEPAKQVSAPTAPVTTQDAPDVLPLIDQDSAPASNAPTTGNLPGMEKIPAMPDKSEPPQPAIRAAADPLPAKVPEPEKPGIIKKLWNDWFGKEPAAKPQPATADALPPNLPLNDAPVQDNASSPDMAPPMSPAEGPEAMVPTQGTVTPVVEMPALPETMDAPVTAPADASPAEIPSVDMPVLPKAPDTAPDVKVPEAPEPINPVPEVLPEKTLPEKAFPEKGKPPEAAPAADMTNPEAWQPDPEFMIDSGEEPQPVPLTGTPAPADPAPSPVVPATSPTAPAEAAPVEMPPVGAPQESVAPEPAPAAPKEAAPVAPASPAIPREDMLPPPPLMEDLPPEKRPAVAPEASSEVSAPSVAVAGFKGPLPRPSDKPEVPAELKQAYESVIQREENLRKRGLPSHMPTNLGSNVSTFSSLQGTGGRAAAVPDAYAYYDQPAPLPEQRLSRTSESILSAMPSDISSLPKRERSKEPISIQRTESEPASPFPEEGYSSQAPVGLTLTQTNGEQSVQALLEEAYQALVYDQNESAVRLYQQALQKSPDNRLALFGLATSYQRNKQTGQARAVYERLLALHPNYTDALNNFLVLVSEEAPGQALAELEKLQQRNPEFSPIHAQMGMICLATNDYEQAARYLSRAVSLSPENLSYRYNLAIAMDKLGQKDEAIALYEQVLNGQKNDHGLNVSPQAIEKRLTYLRTQ